MNLKKNNNNNNYFSQNIQKFGKDFLNYKTPRDIEFESGKIFREISQGKIDIAKYGQYFLNQQFLESCIASANNKFMFHNISFTGLNFMIINDINAAQDMSVLAVTDQHRRSAEAYYIILQVLNTVKVTYDYSYLFGLYDQIRNYRNYL